MTAAVAYPTKLIEADLRLSPAARTKIAELVADPDAGTNLIRIFVAGGGCGGMGYGMTFAEDTTETDSVIESEGFRVAVDPVALNYLRGAEIDFSHGSFVFNNVFQAVGGSGRCGGCGSGGGGGGGGGCGA